MAWRSFKGKAVQEAANQLAKNPIFRRGAIKLINFAEELKDRTIDRLSGKAPPTESILPSSVKDTLDTYTSAVRESKNAFVNAVLDDVDRYNHLKKKAVRTPKDGSLGTTDEQGDTRTHKQKTFTEMYHEDHNKAASSTSSTSFALSAEELEARFQQYDFDADEKWRHVLRNIEIPPGPNERVILLARKRQFYKDHVQPTYAAAPSK